MIKKSKCSTCRKPKEIARLSWALARIAATAEGVVNNQHDKALLGCMEIAKEALQISAEEKRSRIRRSHSSMDRTGVS